MLHNNNIEDQLRQLDNQQLPDLGQMDEHWQQMQAMLQPAAAPLQKGLPKWIMNALSIVAIILLIGGAFFYLSTRKGGADNSGTSNGIVQHEKNAAPVVVPVKDTTEKESTATKQLVSDTKKIDKPVNNNKYFNDDDSVFANMKINFTPCETCPGKAGDSVATAVNRTKLLQNLFAGLKKQDQHFVIDNSRDTLLTCAEGTALLIPSGSLGGKKGIVFTAKEFYKESDIILNQLSTVSNKDQLVTGGMVELKATLDGKAIAIDPVKPLRLYMSDTSSSMNEMQLFDGEIKTVASNLSREKTETLQDGLVNNSGKSNINWLPQSQYFSRKKIITEVRVLNIIDQPFKIKTRRGGQIGYFIVDYDSLRMDKDALKQTLKDKYGYYKVRLRSFVRHQFSSGITDREFMSGYANRIGDSIWMDEQTAARYKLTGPTRQYTVNETSVRYDERNNGLYYRLGSQQADLMKMMQEKYSVNITKLGWINCDRFYKDSRKKIQYAVNLGDSAKNYYTLIVFEKIKSMLNGYVVGNRVLFDDVPVGEKVKIISIGINKTGKTVYALQPATINTQELSGLEFQSTSAPDLKASLSKMDR